MIKKIPSKIRKEAREYASELESVFTDLRKVLIKGNGRQNVRLITSIFNRMDRDERIPNYVTDFYRNIYKTIIGGENGHNQIG